MHVLLNAGATDITETTKHWKFDALSFEQRLTYCNLSYFLIKISAWKCIFQSSRTSQIKNFSDPRCSTMGGLRVSQIK